MHQITRLPNQLTIATAEMPHMASVSVGLWVGVGGRYEPAELNGASHFIEHMLFKGTRKRTAKEISQAVEGTGGYLNAFSGGGDTFLFRLGEHTSELQSQSKLVCRLLLLKKKKKEKMSISRSTCTDV